MPLVLTVSICPIVCIGLDMLSLGVQLSRHGHTHDHSPTTRNLPGMRVHASASPEHTEGNDQVNATPEVTLSDLDPYIEGQLWGPEAAQYVAMVATCYAEEIDGFGGDVDTWATQNADSDTTYYAEQVRLWDLLKGWEYPQEGAQFATAREAIAAEAYAAAYAVHVAVASVLGGE